MKDRLSKAAWIDAAYLAFEQGGIGAVRVDPLAKSLGVTRGSFYWHFEDRAALLAGVLERWHAEKTEATIEANERAGGRPSERLLRLLETCASDDGRFEIGVRAWAAEDAGARSAVESIDDRRIAYMRDLLVGAGLRPVDAQRRARVIYLAWLGAYAGAVTASARQRVEDVKVLWRLALGERAG